MSTDNAHTLSRPKDRTLYVLVLLFLMLSSGIVGAAYLYYRNYAKHFRSRAEQELAAIGNLKAGELAQWRRERLGDAFVLQENPVFTGLARSFMENSEDGEPREQIKIWFEKIQEHLPYERICLLDSSGAIRMSVPEGLPALSQVILQRVPEVLRSGQIRFQDFYRSDIDGSIFLAVLVPVLDGPPEGKPLGVLVMNIDPEQYLYPLLSRWPTPSPSAETLLVRRDGDEVLYLNALRFQKDAALRLRLPITRESKVASVQAMTGHEGIVEAVDYGGRPVLADVHFIPGTPWFMVARMNIEEVYAPLRERLWLIIGIVASLLFCAGAGTALVWRQQRARFYRRQYEAEKSLQHEKSKSQTYLDLVGVMVVAIRSDQTVSLINQAGCRVLGRSEREIVGRNWFDNFLPGSVREEVKTVFARLMAGTVEPLAYVENRVLTGGAGERIIAWHNTVLRDAEGNITGTLSAGEDITERKQMEEELQRSNRELEQFAYIASHDLQEPLRKVAAFADRITSNYAAALDDRGRDYLERMQGAARRMQQLIEDLLKLSRVMTRGESFEPVALAQAIKEALVDLDQQILETGAHISVEDLPTVRGDRVQLQQLFRNLVSNSLKYRMPAAAPRIRISAAKTKNGCAEITVADNGIGFEEKYKDRIFMPFQRLHARSQYQGTGMGLAICSKIAQRHGGSISARSRPGEGAVFTVTLPERH